MNSKDKLVTEFDRAINNNEYLFMVLAIEAEGIEEFIVVPRESLADKLSFYKRSYTDDLIHVMNKNVMIKSFAAVKSVTNTIFI